MPVDGKHYYSKVLGELLDDVAVLLPYVGASWSRIANNATRD
jgi:hypothetical protein